MNNGTGANVYPCQPKDDVRVIRYIKINNVIIQAFKGASVSVDTLDENSNFIYNRFLVMDTNTYLSWNNNDQFLVNWILSQLNLTPTSATKLDYTSDNEFIEV